MNSIKKLQEKRKEVLDLGYLNRRGFMEVFVTTTDMFNPEGLNSNYKHINFSSSEDVFDNCHEIEIVLSDIPRTSPEDLLWKVFQLTKKQIPNNGGCLLDYLNRKYDQSHVFVMSKLDTLFLCLKESSNKKVEKTIEDFVGMCRVENIGYTIRNSGEAKCINFKNKRIFYSKPEDVMTKVPYQEMYVLIFPEINLQRYSSRRNLYFIPKSDESSITIDDLDPRYEKNEKKIYYPGRKIFLQIDFKDLSKVFDFEKGKRYKIGFSQFYEQTEFKCIYKSGNPAPPFQIKYEDKITETHPKLLDFVGKMDYLWKSRNPRKLPPVFDSHFECFPFYKNNPEHDIKNAKVFFTTYEFLGEEFNSKVIEAKCQLYYYDEPSSGDRDSDGDLYRSTEKNNMFYLSVIMTEEDIQSGIIKVYHFDLFDENGISEELNYRSQAKFENNGGGNFSPISIGNRFFRSRIIKEFRLKEICEFKKTELMEYIQIVKNRGWNRLDNTL